MDGVITEATIFIVRHSWWAGPVIGVLAFCESLVLIGVLIPATALMMAVGGMIATGMLDPIPMCPARSSARCWVTGSRSNSADGSVLPHFDAGRSIDIATPLPERVSSYAATAPFPSFLAASSDQCALPYRLSRA
ncbi:hypothetical protein QFZ54_003824 [Sphingomonas faeni]|nr:hypothetical protein [Sphingomonas faeni]